MLKKQPTMIGFPEKAISSSEPDENSKILENMISVDQEVFNVLIWIFYLLNFFT